MHGAGETIAEPRSLTRRGFAVLSAGLLAAGAGSLSLGRAAAREAEPGDDRGGHGNDDPPGDDRGGHGADDPPGEDRGGRRKGRRGRRR
jgi:hypothetical protein